jgi:rhodanese-related sulfurtransferase
MNATLKIIDPPTVSQWLAAGQAVLVDVREPIEHDAVRIAGATLEPLSRFDPRRVGQLQQPGRRLVLHCKGGVRSKQACQKVIDAVAKGQLQLDEVYSLDGGLEAWQRAGLPVAVATTAAGKPRNIIDLQRQVQITVGSGVLIGVILTYFLSPWFLIVPAFFGAGLTFAGLSGTCGLAMILARMPWNQRV